MALAAMEARPQQSSLNLAMYSQEGKYNGAGCYGGPASVELSKPSYVLTGGEI